MDFKQGERENYDWPRITCLRNEISGRWCIAVHFPFLSSADGVGTLEGNLST
jgi:hypothetical protein